MGKKLLSAVIALNFCAPLFAASAVTEDDVRAWLALWQKRAGLEEWNIRVGFADYQELPGEARSDAEWHGKSAFIRFLYPEQWETIFGHTPEVARERALHGVIHQTMHLVIAGLYDDGVDGHTAWLENNPANQWRLECVAENLTMLLLRGHARSGLSPEEYVRLNIDSGPWKPAREVKQRVMLQVLRAMEAGSE